MKRLLATACAILAGCGASVDPADLPSIDGFKGWYSVTLSNDIPGHPHSVRVIHVNDVGRAYPHGGRYPLGTVIVKEIFERRDDGTAGGLRYLGIARKLGDDAGVGATTHDGWLFTQRSSPSSGDETAKDSCWTTCHKAGPWDGLWLDYGE